VITPNNLTMNGGGSAQFHYNGNQTPPPFIPNTVVTLTEWDTKPLVPAVELKAPQQRANAARGCAFSTPYFNLSKA